MTLILSASRPGDEDGDHIQGRSRWHATLAACRRGGDAPPVVTTGRTRFGARTRLAEAAPVLLGERLEAVRRHEERAERLDAEAVHDLRVATRRLRAAISLLVPPSRRDGIDRPAQRLLAALGAVRDLQVQERWLGEPGAAPRSLEAQHGRALARAGRRLARALSRWRAAAPRLAKCFQRVAPKGRLGGHRMRRRLLRDVDRMARRLDRLAGHPTETRAHRARIAAKKLRYHAEVLAAAFPTAQVEIREVMVRLQDALGELHDADVWLARLGPVRGGRALRPAARKRRAAAARVVTAELHRWHREDLATHLAALIRA
jgi:CHAD domain-containing protein